MKNRVISVACTLIILTVIIVGAIFYGKNEVNKENANLDDQVMMCVAMQEESSTVDLEDVLLEAGVAVYLDKGSADDVSEKTNIEDQDEEAVEEQNGTEVASEEAPDEDADEEDDEYKNLAIADVNNYVNVRSKPDTTSEIVGKMYDGSVAEVLSKVGQGEDEWFQVVSGNVEGYIKAEYFIYGDDAQNVIEEYIIRYAVIKADRLNVREQPDVNTKRIGYINHGEKVKIVSLDVEAVQGQWIKVQYTSNKEGYVSADFVTVEESFIYAKSIEEEQAELAALKALQERQMQSEKITPENPVIQVTPPPTDYSNVSELRSAIVNYAMQYLGNRYVMGGQTLAGGTDCSGFTCYIYKEFGINLSRIPHGQWTSNGRQIDVSQIQPGDIVCYSQNRSKCSHVGIYIGNGQIIHSANSRKGVIISSIYYDKTFFGVKNVID